MKLIFARIRADDDLFHENMFRWSLRIEAVQWDSNDSFVTKCCNNIFLELSDDQDDWNEINLNFETWML